VRWNGYTRRGTDLETKKSESEVLLLGIASLVF
jgi:hypothetical protein